MRKTLVLIAVMFTVNFSNAQEVKRTLGVGLQSSFPTYGLSVKYGITDQSVVQATIAPFGAKTDGSSVSINFYGARYVHRFPDNDQGKVSLDPYVFGGLGLINYKVDLSGYDLGSSSESFLGYNVGGGLELIVARKLGISAELGYGRMNVSGGVGVNSIIGGGGIHFYIF